MREKPNLVLAVTNYYNPLPTSISDDTINNFCEPLIDLPGARAETQCRHVLQQGSRNLSQVDKLVTVLNETIEKIVARYSTSTGGRILPVVNIRQSFSTHCTPIQVTLVIPLSPDTSGNLGCSDTWIAPSPMGSGTRRITTDDGNVLVTATYSQVGVHPNDTGHRCIAALIWNASRDKLGLGATSAASCP